jgi:hypothetical protein
VRAIDQDAGGVSVRAEGGGADLTVRSGEAAAAAILAG